MFNGAQKRPAGLKLAVARIAVAAAVAVTVACVAVVWAVPGPSTGGILVGLCLPASVGVVLLWRASVYTWQRGATAARAFVVDEGRAFVLLPDRATMRAVGFVLMCTFPVGYPVIQARDGTLGVIDWATIGLGIVILATSALHAVFLCRGTPRPLVEVVPGGVSARGFFGHVHVPWGAFKPDYAIVPNEKLRLSLPVYTRLAVRGRGFPPRSVRLPAKREPFYQPFSLSAAWSTNPWWAGWALALYYTRAMRQDAIGTRVEHALLVRRLRAYEREIDEELSRYRDAN